MGVGRRGMVGGGRRGGDGCWLVGGGRGCQEEKGTDADNQPLTEITQSFA